MQNFCGIEQLVAMSENPAQTVEDILNPLMAQHLALSTLLWLDSEQEEAWQIVAQYREVTKPLSLRLAMVVQALLEPFTYSFQQLYLYRAIGGIPGLLREFGVFICTLRDYLYAQDFSTRTVVP